MGMKTKKKVWPFILAAILLIGIAILFGILMNKTGKDFSILVGFPILGAIGCIVLTIVFISNNSKLKKVNLNQQSANEGPAESAEIYVPELVADFDNTIKFNFPELPFDEYKCPQELIQKLSVEIEKQHRPSIHTLQEILIDMEHHLGMKNNQSIITLEKIAEGKAGYIEKSFYSFNEITVGYKDIYDANSYLSILAHELSHAYQYSKGKQSIYSNENKTEKFTDALTFYLGFGELTENGKSLKKTRIVGMTDRETKYETQTVVLGYLEKGYFVYLSDLVSRLRCSKEIIKKQKEENSKIIDEIKKLLDAICIYLNTIEITIQTLKDRKFSEEELKIIQEVILKYDTDFFNRLKFKMGEFNKGKLEDNKIKLNDLKKEMEETIKYCDSLRRIADR